MKKPSTILYLTLHYTKDLCLVAQLFMFPFIYYFFKTSFGYNRGLSFFSSFGFMVLATLFTFFAISLIMLMKIEKRYRYNKCLQELKSNRYSPSILAGCILGFSMLNLVIFVTFTIISLIQFSSTLAIYNSYSYLIILHTEIFIITLYVLLRLNSIGHKRSLPLIDLFKYESISDHKVMKKPLY